ncbi:MAG TPA: 5-carboxymethyl-2-hydroxymuconate Delta-isomerase [Caulobacteraceae bacterium]|jgi:5-carboxymethyl-2-hydroxymuconate isomerase|nr:5-carboxymethyl-2-hydroxymuconate Delta-isomerase [Caulobacteraceae bacterium]
MPNAVLEYSANLAAEADISALVKALGARFRESGDVFPVGGVRIRAIGYDDYEVGDGSPENGFVVLTCKIAVGRPEAVKKAFFDDVFELVKAHFAALYARRPLSLTLYVEEIPEGTSYKHNNLHARKPGET